MTVREGPGLQAERTTLAVVRTMLLVVVEALLLCRITARAHPVGALISLGANLLLPLTVIGGTNWVHRRHLAAASGAATEVAAGALVVAVTASVLIIVGVALWATLW